jgi:hypothetical protein
MVFKKKEELGGKVDPNINNKGRIKGIKDKSRREIKDQELLSLLRKIKPHLSESIMVAASIMKNKEAAHANQLKAAVILLGAYRELVKDAYSGGDEEETGTEVQEQNPVFSLTVIKDK